ncbi:PEP-CTERM sorting domain-containing protein [Elioraea rosea]|uniref:PEP-CTERM sorting domain-containing protein n=1 Tax=Elioraea rosea TaxID=2492390 RepID=UPI001181EBA2|nr:PEP-CTERM sorting domain-containing protein [Elioraea rosea]
MRSITALKVSLPLAAAFCGAFAFAAPAEASTIWVRDGNGGTVFNGGPGSVTLTVRVDGVNTTVQAGAFRLQYIFSEATPGGSAPGWTDFLTYCLEPDELLGISGSTPKKGSFSEGLAGTPYAADETALTRLVNTHFADSLTSATKSAAFQVALWEVAYDAVADLGDGAFRYTASGAVRAQALAYLDEASWMAGTENLDVILRIGSQDLIVQVPEPGTMALLLAGLLGLGVAARRRHSA